MQRHDVWLESSWVARITIWSGRALRSSISRRPLRTQAKNAKREASSFCTARAAGRRQITSGLVPPRRGHGPCRSVLGAMRRNTGVDFACGRFPHAGTGRMGARARAEVVGAPPKPIMVYRPLVERTEWNGCAARNPDHSAYAASFFASIRDLFHVVSVADLVPMLNGSLERGSRLIRKFHAGELEFEALAGLFSIASLVFCSPGFAVILAQAVGTPVVATFGSYESSYSFSAGARFSPYPRYRPHQASRTISNMTPTATSVSISQRRPARLADFAAKASEGRAVGLTFARSIGPALTRRFMNPGELEVLVALIGSVKPETVIEIGVNEGRTAKAMPAISHRSRAVYRD